ncbi:Panacea domain-containing protein [Rugamonas rubra]|uniref:Uncharacterized phage-associated protein n=1 Tax=Rugamonas rubra TaxID=758825 RepID=A0A1I4KCD0_9BURK|nr:Panacea domain-containing protein [Rugamonas rubra]SFL76329.1 Uncharacterized phage-associated protein [Rugamonas rubra]
MFKERKAAQMAAALLSKAGGSLNVLKLTKLLYLVEREAMKLHGFQISDDNMVSMPKGPVLSQTLDLTNGARESPAWEHFVEDRESHEVRLKRAVSRADLSGISDAELEVLDAVWREFGNKDQWQLVEFTHDQCGEWEDPDGSSLPIPPKRVFLALGKSAAQADLLDKELRAQKHFDALLQDMDG